MTQVQRKDYTTEDAIKQGQEQAEINVKKEQAESTIADAPTREDIAEDARKTAKANHKAEVKEQKEVKVDSNELTNDTSKVAKEATSESQLHPGFDVLGEQKENDGEEPTEVPASAPEEVKATSSDANEEKGKK